MNAPAIRVIPATNYPTAYVGGVIHHLGRVYQVESAEPVGNRGWQVTARAAHEPFTRFFFIDTQGKVRA